MGKKMAKFQTLRAETRGMIKGEEDIDVEFKSSVGNVDPEYFVAFANARGGTILVGVAEQTTDEGRKVGKVVGCKVTDRNTRAILTKAKSCRPPVDIQVVQENLANKPIYRVDIPEGKNKPCGTDGGTYKIRVEGANVGIDPQMMEMLIIAREEEKFLSRFRQAAEEVVKKMSAMETNLQNRIEQVESAAEEAKEAAERAEAAGEMAHEAANEAAMAAIDLHS